VVAAEVGTRVGPGEGGGGLKGENWSRGERSGKGEGKGHSCGEGRGRWGDARKGVGRHRTGVGVKAPWQEVEARGPRA